MNEKLKRWILSGAAIFGGIAVVLGAIGAHPPEGFFETSEDREGWRTAVYYQMFHVLAIIAVTAVLCGRPKFVLTAVVLYFLGTILFSGSIYFLSVGGPSFLGPITPIGGLLLIAGWFCLAVGYAIPSKRDQKE